LQIIDDTTYLNEDDIEAYYMKRSSSRSFREGLHAEEIDDLMNEQHNARSRHALAHGDDGTKRRKSSHHGHEDDEFRVKIAES
jgi:hypothetical protein